MSGILQPFLSVTDLEAVMATPIGDPRRKDRLVWAATRNGRYLVQSGYRWCQSRSLKSRDLRLPDVRSILKNVLKCV